MKNVDYIIVGDGYAGLFLAHQLIKNNKSFVIFSEEGKVLRRFLRVLLILWCLKSLPLSGKLRNKLIF